MKMKNFKCIFILTFLAFSKISLSQNPSPSITLSSIAGCVGANISMFGNATGGSVSSWAWTASPSTGISFTAPNAQNTSANFSSAGIYTITLTVQPGGSQASALITISNCGNTSITERELNAKTILFPNPAKEQISIELNQNIKVEKIEIYNNLGQEVLRQIINDNESILNLNVKGLAPGIYSIKVYTEKGLVSKSIIIE